MQERRQADIQKYKRRHQKRKAWRNVVRILACVVVFCTTYALILPAITMEKDTFCGMEAHVHEEACYGELAAMVCEPGADLPVIHSHDALCYSGEQLICKLPEVAEHIHGESCYETVTLEAHTHGESCYAPQRGNLLCEIPEEESHAHGGDCYTPGETLLCTEAERAGHSHGAACYNTETVLTCTTAETQGHSHGEGCYDADGNLICTEAEVAAHTHGDGCYTTTQTLICTEAEDPGHTHGNDCYEQVLSCTLEEKAGHAHTDECYEMTDALTCGLEERAETVYDRVLVCTLPQVAVHTHADACYEGGVLTCQIQCATVHQHTEDCIQIHAQTEENLICELEVHEHTLACYSNPQADVESSADWEESVSKVKLTGNWRQDLVAIAKSQLGYNESTKNYIVGEDGETIYGYSRYGAWYGAPYGDWCAMYASFCIRYAGISGMPLDANCPNWIRQLAERGLYHDESDYTPEAGDLIFFDWNDDGSSDHVGIVVEVNGEKVKTIEGNSGDTVAYHTYNLSNVTIQGYGSLPRQLTEAERAAVDNVIALIDAMPSADEIDAKIAEFEELEDYEGEEAWLTEVYQQIGNTYVAYRDLGEELQMFVTNRDKLLELEYIWSVIPLPESGATIAQTVAFKTDLLTNTNRFVIYTRGTDNQYYAIDSDGEAVPVTIDAAGNLKSIASDPTALYWTFTKNNNDNNYRIRNVKSTNKYIRLNTQVVGNDQSITVSDKSDGTFTLRRDNTHQLGYSNKAFAIVNNSNNAATLYLAQAPAMVKVWFDGTCGGTENYEGAGGKLKGESEFTAMELPEKNAVLPDTWEGPHEYDYVLRGWYDIVNGVYYEAGATVENLEAGVIFYADWRARTYDVGKNEEGKVSNTVSTDHFITTRMYDYGVLFNMYSETPTITRNNNGEPTAVTWSIVEQGENAVHQKTDASGNPTGEKDTSMGFIFRDWEQSVNSRWIKLGQPTNWDQEPVAHINNYHPQDAKKVNNQTPKDGTTRGILGTDSRILDRLFTTSGGVLGQEYLGTADHLFHYGTDPSNTETYGYYYYDSEWNAASYNQSDKRFYVYNYLEQTADGYGGSGGKYADFLPFNSPYANTKNNAEPGAGSFSGGKTGYLYDSKTDGEDNASLSAVSSNLWFGMKTEIKFFLPNNPGQKFTENGQTVYGNRDMNGNPMIFEFTGDDDVWIFVDDVLVLDIGGIHGVMEGSINFATGEIKISKEYTDRTLYNNNAVTTESYFSTDYLMDAAKFQGGKQHTLTMYYMERGDSLSNCRVRFNISPRYQMNIQKEDAVNRHKLDGAIFGVFMDVDCTQEAELWPTKAAYERGDTPTHTFTISDGQGTIWGMVAGNVYYIKELQPPVLDADGDGENDYQIPKGLIKLTLKTDGETDYDVLEMVNDGHGDAPSNGFSAYGFKINPVTEEAFMVITNGKNVEETTDVTVEKVWNGGTDHPSVKVYLKVGNERIREATLSSKNNWHYTWVDLPKYSDDLDENGGPIPLQYTVEEGVVPGYVMENIESEFNYTTTITTWNGNNTLEANTTYLLKSSHGFLSTTNVAEDTGFKWVTQDEAETSPQAQWTATFEDGKVRLKNGSNQYLGFYYGNGSPTDFFAHTSESENNNTKRYFNYSINDSGMIIYYQNGGNRYYLTSNFGTGNNNTTKFQYGGEGAAMRLVPMTKSTVTKNVGAYHKITNAPATQTTSVTVKKNWTMSDGVTPVDPALYQDLQITIRLKADGEDAGLPTRTLELVDGWSYTFNNLPVTNSSGQNIVYSVEEVWSNENWTPSYSPISGNAADGFQLTITNRYTQKIEIPVQKQWSSNIPESQRPESLNVYLYKTTGTGQAPTPMGYVVLTAEKNWTDVFQVISPAAGETYYIYESTENYYATYEQPATVILEGKAVTMGQVSFAEDTGQPVAVIVTNRPMVDLPMTGGPGTILYTAGGLLLMLAAIILLHNKYQKRRREGSSSF